MEITRLVLPSHKKKKRNKYPQETERTGKKYPQETERTGTKYPRATERTGKKYPQETDRSRKKYPQDPFLKESFGCRETGTEECETLRETSGFRKMSGAMTARHRGQAPSLSNLGVVHTSTHKRKREESVRKVETSHRHHLISDPHLQRIGAMAPLFAQSGQKSAGPPWRLATRNSL